MGGLCVCHTEVFIAEGYGFFGVDLLVSRRTVVCAVFLCVRLLASWLFFC